LADGASATKVSFGTEAGFFAELGLSTVVIGPGDMASDGHKPHEGISKSELIACCAMMGNILNTLTTDD
jgi:acetylornithine deacetylase